MSITAILTHYEISDALDECLENGYVEIELDDARLLMELNNDSFIAGTFFYEVEIDGELGPINHPETEVTHLEEITGGATQTEHLHTAAMLRDDIVYTNPPTLATTGETSSFDFGLQVRDNE